MDIDKIIQTIGFPSDEKNELKSLYGKIKNAPEFLKAVKDSEITWKNAEKSELSIKNWCAETGLCPYTVLLLILFSVYEKSEKIYKEKNIPDEIFKDSLRDISLKAPICRKNYGVFGTNCFPWHLSILHAVRIKIGRLQYELLPFTENDTVIDGVLLEKNKTYVNCHIPEDGPLTPESVDESLAMAAKFFGYTDVMPITCTSWLILPEYQNVCFPTDSNTYKFVSRFTPIKTFYEDDFEDSWRIFYTDNWKNTAALPSDTSLQRRFKAYIENGGKFGETLGAFIYRIK